MLLSKSIKLLLPVAFQFQDCPEISQIPVPLSLFDFQATLYFNVGSVVLGTSSYKKLKFVFPGFACCRMGVVSISQHQSSLSPKKAVVILMQLM